MGLPSKSATVAAIKNGFSWIWPLWLPFVGHLKLCEFDDIKEALAEIFWTTVTSTFPLWFGALVFPLIFEGSEVVNELQKSVKSGELFLYSTALLGPLAYTLNKDYGESNGQTKVKRFFLRTIKFPHSGYFMIASLAILVLSSSVLYIIRNPELHIAEKLNAKGITRLSELTFLASTAIYFIASCYRNTLDGFRQKKSQGREEDNFAKDFRERSQ